MFNDEQVADNSTILSEWAATRMLTPSRITPASPQSRVRELGLGQGFTDRREIRPAFDKPFMVSGDLS